MGKRVVFIGAALFSWSVIPAQVFAYNQTITVYATVAEMRAVYLNGSGAIIKIAGNTPNNIQPKVYDSLNNEVAMTPDIQKQYDDFLADHGGKLQASKIYLVNPVTVSSQGDSQTISIVPQTTSLNLSL